MDNHGALVGWTHQDLGERIMLCIETVRSTQDAANHTPDTLRVLLTKQQAAVLGNFLMTISGKTVPDQHDRALFRRLFG